MSDVNQTLSQFFVVLLFLFRRHSATNISSMVDILNGVTEVEETSFLNLNMSISCLSNGTSKIQVSNVIQESGNFEVGKNQSQMKLISCCNFWTKTEYFTNSSQFCLIHKSNFTQVILTTTKKSPVILEWNELSKSYKTKRCVQENYDLCLDIGHFDNHHRHSAFKTSLNNDHIQDQSSITDNNEVTHMNAHQLRISQSRKYILLNIGSKEMVDDYSERCEEGPSNMQDFNVIFEFAPQIHVESNEVVLTRTQKDLNLSCTISGNPKPLGMWFKDKRKLHTSNSNQIHIESNFSISIESLNSCTIIISLVTKSGTTLDELRGHYACFAVNNYGEASADIIVKSSGRQFYVLPFNFLGFMLGMVPPLVIAFYIIMKLGYRSRYATDRTEEEEI